jgi:non-homologous end joining protein Ku
MARQDIGIPDEIYDIVSVLYHALQGAETYDQYIQKIQIESSKAIVIEKFVDSGDVDPIYFELPY